MGLKWSRSQSTMEVGLEAMKGRARDVAAQIIEEVVQEAAWDMRNIIATSGTPQSGKPGRIETGDMWGDVGYPRNLTTRAGRVSAKFGWGLAGKKARKYYSLQEEGFWHVGAQRQVVPMHALLGAYVKAKINMQRKLRKATKR